MNLKRLSAFFVLLLLATCTMLVACGGGDEPGDDSGTSYTVYCFKSEGAAAEEIKLSAEQGNTISPAKRAHYKFLGYYTAEGTQIFDASGKQIEGLLIDKNITVYARFEPIGYTVTFVAGEGTLPQGAATSVTLNADAWQLIAPVPTAPTQLLQFEGWYNRDFTVRYADANGTVDYAKFTLSGDLGTSNGEIKLYAKYSTRTVKVTIDYNDFATPLKEIEVAYGSELGDLSSYKIEDTVNKREIVGFSTSPSELLPPAGALTEDLHLFAIWKSYKYVTIVYEDFDAEVRKVYDGGASGAELPTPEKPGFYFDGFYTSPTYAGNPVEYVSFWALADTYYAKLTLAEYTLTFNTAGSGVDALSAITYYYGDTTALPELTRTGYSFLGWSLDSDGVGEAFYNIPADLYGTMTLYAAWEAKSYAVTLDPTGGVSSSTTEIVSYLSTHTFPVPSRVGYTFLGWFDGTGDDAVKMTNPRGVLLTAWANDGGATLYAKWQICTYRVIYQTNGGTTVSSETYEHGEHLVLPATPAKAGMIFGGWFNEEGVTEYVYGTPITENVTLYAKWIVGVAISTPADLEKLRQDPTGTYYLANDINLNNQTWTLIPSFSGKLYGQGHSIKNFIISANETTDRLGFFGTNSGTVRDVTFEGVSLNYTRTASWCAAAVIAAHNVSEGAIINCTVKNAQINFTHTATEKAVWHCFVAGVAGANNGTILQCTVDMTVRGTSRGFPHVNWEPHYTSSAKVGGIAGENYGGTLRFCTATVNMELTGAALDDNQKDWYQSCLYGGAVSYLGGIAGQNVQGGLIENCRVVSGSRIVATQVHDGIYNIQIGAHVGGLVGYNGATVSACAVEGATVSSAGWVEGNESHYNSYVGGFAGNNSGKIENCYAVASVTCTAAYHDVGGFIGYNSGMINNCYANSTATNQSSGTGYQFVGWNAASGSVTGCFSHGAFGGSAGSIFNCFNIGTVTNANATPTTAELVYTEAFLRDTLYWSDAVWMLHTNDDDRVSLILKWQNG